MFYVELNGNCSNEDYDYAKLFYKKLSCKKLGFNIKKYMINDVLVLANAFKTFWKGCMNYYELNTCWFSLENVKKYKKLNKKSFYFERRYRIFKRIT